MIEACNLVKRYGSRREDHHDADDPGPGRGSVTVAGRSYRHLPVRAAATLEGRRYRAQL
jgi:hypothetical protein